MTLLWLLKKQILESDELLQRKRKAYHLSDEGFEEYKKFLSDPDQKKFCFKGYYYVEGLLLYGRAISVALIRIP